MIGLGSDKNIHMMTIKSNCSQLQVHCDKISDVVGDICCATAIFDSLYSGVEYTVGKAPINIIPNHTEHETLPTLTLAFPSTVFGSSKLYVIFALCFLQIDGLVRSK